MGGLWLVLSIVDEVFDVSISTCVLYHCCSLVIDDHDEMKTA